MALDQPGRYRQTPPRGSGAPSSSEDVARQLAEELGLSPDVAAQLGAGGGGDPYAIFGISGDLTNAPVGTGVSLRPPRRRPGPPIGARGTERAKGRQFLPGGGLISSTLGETLKQFYRMTPSVLRRTQALLYAGGFYGDVDVTDVAWGTHDEQSFAAWAQLIERTARLNMAGEEVTYTKVLSEAALAAGLDMDSFRTALESGDDQSLESLLGMAGGEVEGRLIDIILSDPNALRSTMDRASSAVLGRKSNAAEQRMFISMIHGLQREGQTARQTAEPQVMDFGTDPASMLGLDDSFAQPGDVVTEYAPPDEGATAEQLARQQNPAEAGAHDIAIQFASFLDLLQAPVNVPRVTI